MSLSPEERKTKAREEEYRRGYLDGFVEAVNAMDEATQAQLYTHWRGPLDEWRFVGLYRVEFPPKWGEVD